MTGQRIGEGGGSGGGGEAKTKVIIIIAVVVLVVVFSPVNLSYITSVPGIKCRQSHIRFFC